MHEMPRRACSVPSQQTRPGAVRGAVHLAVPLAAALGLAVTFMASTAGAQALGAYEFTAPPSAEANRVYGVDRKTGEMSACQFERPEGSPVGVTRCFARGPGAGAQVAGRYGLVATNYKGETGVFRVNYKSGEMSICYVRDLPGADGKPQTTILCTPQAR